MYLTLLIVTQVTAEWVEISQQHYRKPIRTHSSYNPFTTPDSIEVDEATQSWNHDNRNVTEYNWNKPTVRQSSIGNVKQVQYPGSVINPTEVVKDDEDYPNGDKFDLKPNHLTTKPTTEFSENTKQKGTIEKVPNIGNVKRVQLNNSPVKSPVITIGVNEEELSKSRYEEFPIDNEPKLVALFEGKKNTETKHNRRIYVNKIRNKYTTEAFPIEDVTSFTEQVQVEEKFMKPEFHNSTNIKTLFSSRPTIVTETKDFVGYEKHDDKFHKPAQSLIDVTNRKHIFNKEGDEITKKLTKDQEIQKLTKQTLNDSDTKDPDDKTRDLDKHQPFKSLQAEQLINHDDIPNDQLKQQKKGNNVKSELGPQNKKVSNVNQNKDNVNKISNGNKSTNKVNNMDSLLKLMKIVADTISQNTRRSFGGKMTYLHELKDSILTNIAERIDTTWPDDDVMGVRRRSRSAHASPRGHHMAFPSSESALMTISFLTFAVFLIKLVLQVINTYKNKAMMVAPVMVAAAGRTASAHRENH